MVCAKCGGSWLTAGSGSFPKNRLKAKFDIALFHDALDSPLAQLAGQGEDGCGRVAQLSVLLLHPVEFARLTDGRSFVSPATNLLGVDVHELHLLGVNAVDAVNGSVVHDMRARRCLSQRLDVRARVLQRLVDHAGDERHFADGLPVHRLGMWHGGFLCLGFSADWPRPNSRVTSRHIGLASISGSSQARSEPHFLQNTHFVKSDGPRVTAFRALAPKLAPVSTGEMSKVPASMVSLLLESQLSGGFSEMAAGDTTVGSRPSWGADPVSLAAAHHDRIIPRACAKATTTAGLGGNLASFLAEPDGAREASRSGAGPAPAPSSALPGTANRLGRGAHRLAVGACRPVGRSPRRAAPSSPTDRPPRSRERP